MESCVELALLAPIVTNIAESKAQLSKGRNSNGGLLELTWR